MTLDKLLDHYESAARPVEFLEGYEYAYYNKTTCVVPDRIIPYPLGTYSAQSWCLGYLEYHFGRSSYEGFV